MNLYSAFGLGLAATGAIPRLDKAAGASRVDVRIHLGGHPSWLAPASGSAPDPSKLRFQSPHRDAHGTSVLTITEWPNGWLRHVYADGCDFVIEPHGREVWARWPAAYTIDDVSSYLLGPVMGFILRLRGQVCLHASAFAQGGRAFAIVGPAGAGKSTTAVAIAALGSAMLADDIVPLAHAAGVFVAAPGYPRARLWPASVGAMAHVTPAAPRLPAGWQGQRYHLDLTEPGFQFQRSPLPLAAVYVLASRSSDIHHAVIEPVVGEEALMALISNSFASNLLDARLRADDLTTMGRLANTVPVLRVRAADDLGGLAEMARRLLRDCARHVRPVPSAAVL